MCPMNPLCRHGQNSNIEPASTYASVLVGDVWASVQECETQFIPSMTTWLAAEIHLLQYSSCHKKSQVKASWQTAFYKHFQCRIWFFQRNRNPVSVIKCINIKPYTPFRCMHCQRITFIKSNAFVDCVSAGSEVVHGPLTKQEFNIIQGDSFEAQIVLWRHLQKLSLSAFVSMWCNSIKLSHQASHFLAERWTEAVFCIASNMKSSCFLHCV
jgi:hypothetical protein